MMAIPGDPSDWAPGMEQNERLNKCDAKDCAFAATLAFLFGTHARVGADSPIRKLTSELAHRVCELIRPPEPRTYAAAGGWRGAQGAGRGALHPDHGQLLLRRVAPQ